MLGWFFYIMLFLSATRQATLLDKQGRHSEEEQISLVKALALEMQKYKNDLCTHFEEWLLK